AARWLRWGAIGLLVVSIGGMGWWRLSGARQRACGEAMRRFELVWTKDARNVVRDSFKAALPGQGPETFVSVEAAIDGWVNEWKDAQRTICDAQGVSLLDNRVERQLGCLDE